MKKRATSPTDCGPRCYVYKVIVDSGGAPCVYRNLLSLAICKPAIRRTAKVGDLVFGFGGNNEQIPNRLVYIAEITEKSTGGDYYYEPRFAKRPDCIYRWTAGDELVLKDDAKFHQHADARPRDVGRYSRYGNASVLLSKDFRYFGASATDDWKRSYPTITKLVEGMGQGHRVNHGPRLSEELLELKAEMWQTYAKVKLGEPVHGRKKQDCHSAPCDEDECVEVTKTGCERVC
ncbi:hypothetical protein NZK35_17830 [Stieleria sp. ICT_E10.1]|uniref:Nmad2 family putative nucleotide modification protein n=1 Tax=Stieleria sedimenti TaxID=2976331 RepID=UPI00217FFC55|nr:hypothetical protein [Stieleria sedimenti]MCS7468516.1 hypothetical protein [Stieleria sedimenti]